MQNSDQSFKKYSNIRKKFVGIIELYINFYLYNAQKITYVKRLCIIISREFRLNFIIAHSLHHCEMHIIIKRLKKNRHQ